MRRPIVGAHGAVPTGVGVNLVNKLSRCTEFSRPHGRGGEPSFLAVALVRSSPSPRAWG